MLLCDFNVLKLLDPDSISLSVHNSVLIFAGRACETRSAS